MMWLAAPRVEENRGLKERERKRDEEGCTNKRHRKGRRGGSSQKGMGKKRRGEVRIQTRNGTKRIREPLAAEPYRQPAGSLRPFVPRVEPDSSL